MVGFCSVSLHRLAKDVVKAVKKRLQHRKPKVQLLALTVFKRASILKKSRCLFEARLVDVCFLCFFVAYGDACQELW